jgi:protease-4
VEIAELDRLADRAPLLREAACESNLLDHIGFRDEAYLRIAELAGAGGLKDPDCDDAPPRLFLSRYVQAGAPPKIPGRSRRPAIAVVTVSGPIVSGRGGPQVFPMSRGSAGGDTIAAALREAAADDGIKAVVLRVDSPGGAVTGSETIWREVCRVREAGKPVVASMGAVAASGGYYVAMAADRIVANPGTVTGSIGVVTGKLVARDLKERLGLGSESLRTNTNADAWSVNAPFTEEQHALVEAEADLFYDDFVRRAAEARGLSVQAVDAVARGRIWTGADALAHGLVDELGGLRTAVRRAKLLAGLDPDTKVRLAGYPGSSIRDQLRPKASSRPAAGLPEWAAGLLGAGFDGLVGGAERSITGPAVIWRGDPRF